MECLPGVSAIEGPSSFEPPVSSDPPTLQSAELVEGSVFRALSVPEVGRAGMSSGFAAFLDGAQKVQVMGDHGGVPIVYGTASSAIRIRVDRRMVTWGHERPRVERRFFLPFRYLPPLSEISARFAASGVGIDDTAKADKSGSYPSLHPTALLDRALKGVATMRETLEQHFAEAWCASEKVPLFIDGGITNSPDVASSSNAVGVIKTHRHLYVEGNELKTVFGLSKGERSPVFRIEPRWRHAAISWYLRVRDRKGHDAMWGLVRVEISSETKAVTERADEISRWIIAEMSPLSLPDGRWDKMAYGVRDTEEFLRAIS